MGSSLSSLLQGCLKDKERKSTESNGLDTKARYENAEDTTQYDTDKDSGVKADSEHEHASSSTIEDHADALQEVTLKLDRVGAKETAVAGYFSDWEPMALRETTPGSFQTEVVLTKGQTHEFRLVVDGAWVTSDAYPNAPNGLGGTNNILTL